MLIKIKKNLLILAIIVLAVAINLDQKVSAATFDVGASCTYNVYKLGMSCEVFNDKEFNMTGVSSVVISSNNFDDKGGIKITGPLGTVQDHDAPGVSFGGWPNGTDITSWFNFDGMGGYTVRVFAEDLAATDMGGWINLTVSTIRTFCGDNIRQTPNEVGTGGPANDGNEQCDGTDNAACGGLACSDCSCKGWIQYTWGGNYDTTNTCGGGATTMNCTSLNGTASGCPVGQEWSGCGIGPSACYAGIGPECSSPLRCADQFDACGCACVSSTVCSDTDGGKVYNVVGTTTGLNASGDSITKTDFCSGSALFEYYCDSTLDPALVYAGWHACPFGCSGGACSSCVPSCPGGCADVGQPDGCGGTCPNNNGNPCNDGNSCTSGDTCSGGSCSGTAITCNDGNACTTDSCNTASGCVFLTIAPSCVLTATPSSIDIESSSLLEWTTNCVDNASVDNGIGVVSVPTGNSSVSPTSLTSYNMTVTSLAGGTGTCAATVDINPICSLSASPPSIFLGNASTLTWAVEYASSITIDNGIGSVASNGTQDIYPAVTTDYILTATNPSGVSVNCAKTVIVKPCEKGIIPCGRYCDVISTTNYKENDPCTLCHLILMVQLIIDFIVEVAAVIAAFFLAIAGFMYIFAGGKPDKITFAKTILKTTLIGFAIIFIAWIMVDTILTMFGFIDPLGDGNWHVMC